ncbi:MAG TPA: nicotinate (nicotinamide) nucleotide adenylyltransferase [Gemmatimonadetes bacterium]|nr:nicotinate (nicotinamide) nucleotide adenylyltransferase [Gemmatimonadota bacterium]
MIPARAHRLGVLGGTFDPPHVGHLIVARDAAAGLGLDRVFLVLAARPPHKRRVTAPPGLRLEMLEAASADDPVLVASDIEVRRAGTSYTVDTLRELSARYPEAELVLLIGVDQWRQLADWKDPQGIARLATVAVMAREGEDPAAVDPGVSVPSCVVPVTRIDVSATDVRARARQGRSIRHLVPDAARIIIERETLYPPPAVQHA